MSSISVGELITALSSYPDDDKVVMSLTEYDPATKDHKKHYIAYINGVGKPKDRENWHEVYLMN